MAAVSTIRKMANAFSETFLSSGKIRKTIFVEKPLFFLVFLVYFGVDKREVERI